MQFVFFLILNHTEKHTFLKSKSSYDSMGPPPPHHHTHTKKILWVRGIYYGNFLSLAIKIDGESKLTSYCACMDIVVFNA